MTDNQKFDASREVIKSDTFNDNSFKIAYGITWLGGNVHESITKEAVKQAGIQYTDKLERGIRWNDAPSDNPVKPHYFGLAPGIGDINTPGTITYRSHHGDLQNWHSMMPSDKPYTNAEVRDKIISQSVEFFEQARSTNNLVYLGKLLHTVQDGYVLSHVERNANNQVTGFQDYNEQDHGAHSSDEMRQIKTVTEIVGIQRQVPQDWQDVPGTKDAVKASADIIKLYIDPRKTSKDLADYLRDKVYPFENEYTQHLPAGGSNPKYQKSIAQSSGTTHLTRQETISLLAIDKPNLAATHVAVSDALVNGHEQFSGITEPNRFALAEMIRERALKQSIDIPKIYTFTEIGHADASVKARTHELNA